MSKHEVASSLNTGTTQASRHELSGSDFVVTVSPVIEDDNGTSTYVWTYSVEMRYVSPAQHRRSQGDSLFVIGRLTTLIAHRIIPTTDALEEVVRDTGFEITEDLRPHNRTRYTQVFEDIWPEVVSEAPSILPRVKFGVRLEAAKADNHSEPSHSSSPRLDEAADGTSTTELDRMWDRAVEIAQGSAGTSD